MKTGIKALTIRPETHRDYKDIVSLVVRSFREGTDYSDGTDIVALIEEIRNSEYYIPELAFVAELDGKIVGHFLFHVFRCQKLRRADTAGRMIPTSSCLHPYPFTPIPCRCRIIFQPH